MPKEEQVNIRLTQEEKRQLQNDATEQQRTASNLLLWCWKQWREAKKGKANERRSSK